MRQMVGLHSPTVARNITLALLRSDAPDDWLETLSCARSRQFETLRLYSSRCCRNYLSRRRRLRITFHQSLRTRCAKSSASIRMSSIMWLRTLRSRLKELTYQVPTEYRDALKGFIQQFGTAAAPTAERAIRAGQAQAQAWLRDLDSSVRSREEKS